MHGNRNSEPRARIAGITLIELLVAVAVVGILAVIAIPSYTQYVTRSNRAVAKTVLLQVADRQERYFANNKGYTSNLSDLGYASNGFMIDNNGISVEAGSSNRVYSITLAAPTSTTFTVSAAPQLKQASRDSACGTLTLTHAGQREPSNCW